MNHFIEIRTLNLKPGTREEFQRLYIEEALPYSTLELRCGGARSVIILQALQRGIISEDETAKCRPRGC